MYGDFEMLDGAHESVVAFRRWGEEGEGGQFLTVLNFSGGEVVWEGLGMGGLRVGRWVAGNYDERGLKGRGVGGEVVVLRPWEGLLGVLE